VSHCSDTKELRKQEGKETLFMPVFLLRPPYIFLIFAFISVAVGVISTCAGASPARGGRIVYRAQDPKQFWECVTTWYLAGVVFIGWFLYKVYVG